MTSAEHLIGEGVADVGLLTPFTVTSAAEVASGDAAVVRAMLAVERAFAVAMAAQKLAPDALVAAFDAVDASSFDVRSIAVRGRDGANPVIPFVKDLRAQFPAELAPHVHRGMTSQDVLDTALVLVAREVGGGILRDLDAAAAALDVLANAHRGTLMVGRTLTQPGAPTSFGLVAAGWLHGIVRAREAVRAAVDALPAQLGGAVGTADALVSLAASAGVANPGATALAVRLGFAAELGMPESALPWHTARAPFTGLGEALASASSAIGVIANDVLLGSRSEIAELSERVVAGRGGSSTMPQKRNPALSTLASAACRRVPGLVAELHRSAADAVDQRPPGAWQAEWAVVRDALRYVGGAAALLAELVPGLQVDAERMRSNVEVVGPAILAEHLGMSAGHLVAGGRLAELATTSDSFTSLAQALRTEPGLAVLGDERVAALADPASALGLADSFIDAARAEYRMRLAAQAAAHPASRPDPQEKT